MILIRNSKIMLKISYSSPKAFSRIRLPFLLATSNEPDHPSPPP